ncbi:MAG: hypothetical protein KDD69_04275 [Bdellovibrionales bacterium]|nr:hypothetical protein [Bdellovibrionales bacterium]
MLCPYCNNDIDESLGGCGRCADVQKTALEESPPSAAIGRIAVERVARVVTPEERQAIERQRADYYAGKVVRDTEELLAETALDGSSRARRRLLIVCGLLLMGAIGFFLATSELSFQELLPPSGEPSTPQTQARSSEAASKGEGAFRPSGAADPDEPIGFIAIGGETVFLNSSVIRYHAESDQVEVQFGSSALASQPTLKVYFFLQRGATELSLETLERYSLELQLGKQRMVFEREYSRRLTPFGEVGQLLGPLRAGGVLKGTLHDARQESVDGRTYQVEWQLSFSGALDQ